MKYYLILLLLLPIVVLKANEIEKSSFYPCLGNVNSLINKDTSFGDMKKYFCVIYSQEIKVYSSVKYNQSIYYVQENIVKKFQMYKNEKKRLKKKNTIYRSLDVNNSNEYFMNNKVYYGPTCNDAFCQLLGDILLNYAKNY